ncbi:UDP-2,4-diacetamido-2,4,6-trideoxy-beta-L-altropyranose hydrolase [Caulobacter ginsengisoli]|uniref:UDP-2,4-diacetamido-2,4, 6-trideoxy-beta-L-altropyranose hydrolase n=1 Tax=Caulobacter ginsengisoli TaxID=400775 RepID=A0ABU0IXM8_9CAUL|nr:UDP-2,4-diacetamido-2,4,6-trideoxy-beta-L-altropyranose hydrolase [Caulobacter ginsengisoli]MDQ0466096.1 UDP-2,4-diacetamido-2,4,6-trideoxy-beta-L-altropyranose hydrolase [Caulobacter ginsengisoli]
MNDKPQKLPRILFVCEASPELGGGHVMRCLTLARALQGQGADCVFLNGTGVARILAAFAPDMALSEDEAADLVVLDSYRMGREVEDGWREKAGALAVIDDLARPHHADLVLDPSFGRHASDYEAPTVLAGPDYALVRREFAEVRQAALARRGGPVARALVALGLTDVGGITGRTVQALLPGLGGVALDVVVGSGAYSLPALQALADQGAIGLHVDSQDMAGLMSRADIAIGAGGASLWERACLGLPAVTLIVADNQRDLAMRLDGAGVTLALDARWPGLEARLVEIWGRLVGDEALRQGLSRRSAALCDGLGAGRAAVALLALVSQAG